MSLGASRDSSTRLRESALVVLVAREAQGLSVLLGLRARGSRFLPGQWAFPGGRLEDADEPSAPGAHARCAARELREETGLVIDPAALIAAGVRVTPPLYPMRFRTEFFVAVQDGPSPRPLDPLPQPEEIEAAEFVGVAPALDEWFRGLRPVAPPVLPLLRVLRALPRDLPAADIANVVAEANALEEAAPRIEPFPGIWIVPQRTETIPPATHTNAYLAGGRTFVVVDPGSAAPGEVALLQATIERRLGEGDAMVAILLTHHHRDHVSGALSLARERRLPVRAHSWTRLRLAVDADALAAFGPDLEDGEVLDLSGATFRAWHTPGHAPGHVAIVDESRGLALTGDLVSGLSTIVIPPDGGDMGLYLASLRRLEAASLQTLLPSHGPPLSADFLRRAREHREKRGGLVLAALAREPRALEEIASLAYAEDQGVPLRLAAAQTLAHLGHLAAQGLAREVSGLWQSTAELPAEREPRSSDRA